MYTIYYGGNLIYSPTLIEEGYSAFDIVLAKEVGKVSTLTFTLPYNAIGWPMIAKLYSTIVVRKDGEVVFVGRPLNIDRDFENYKTIYCEDVLGYLNDSIIRPYQESSYNGKLSGFLAKLETEHNSQVNNDRKIHFRTTSTEDFKSSSEDYQKTIDIFTNDLGPEELKNGYFVVNYEENNGVITSYIDWVVDRHYSSQDIVFSKNIIDLSEKIVSDDIYTVVIPFGKDNITVASVNDGKDYLENATGIANYGRIVETISYDDITTASELKTKALEEMEEAINKPSTIEINAIDMNLISSEEAIKLGYFNRVVSAPHGLSLEYQCVKTEIHIDAPDESTYQFGVPESMMTAKYSYGFSEVTVATNENKAAVKSLQQSTSSAIERNASQIPIVNILPSVYWRENSYGDSWQSSGITWTVNQDGSVTANGTATSASGYHLCGETLVRDVPVIRLDPTKQYTVSGCPSGGGNSSYQIRARFTTSSETPSSSSGVLLRDSGSGIVVDAGYSYVYLYCWIAAGYTVNNLTFYPMLELGSEVHKYMSTHNGTRALAARIKALEDQLSNS